MSKNQNKKQNPVPLYQPKGNHQQKIPNSNTNNKTYGEQMRRSYDDTPSDIIIR